EYAAYSGARLGAAPEAAPTPPCSDRAGAAGWVILPGGAGRITIRSGGSVLVLALRLARRGAQLDAARARRQLHGPATATRHGRRPGPRAHGDRASGPQLQEGQRRFAVGRRDERCARQTRADRF